MGLGKKMFQGLAWSAIGRISVQAIQFILGIVLARILTPKDYGIIGILIVFISISNVFIDSGFTKALIQKQNRSEDDISTVFLFNIGISVFCYSLLWVCAPIIANFYNIEQLTVLLRALAFVLITGSLFAIPSTLLTIDMDFKSLFKIKFVATLISGSIAVYLAYTGYGVWALVAQSLINSLITLVLMWIFVSWRPSWVFSKSSLKGLFSYGSKLLISSLLNVTVNNFYSLFIAKLISTKDLGYYTRGTQFSDTVYSTFSSILDNVLLPGLATVQDKIEILIKHTRSVIRATALIIVPIFLFLALMAKPIIVFLLTEKWLPAVPIMQIFCIARCVTIVSGINVNLLYVIGRTDLALRQQYVKLAVRVILLIAALKFGIVYIALAELASTIIHFFINTYYPGKIMQYGAIRQLKDMSPVFLASTIMIVFIFLATFAIDSNPIKLLIGGFLSLPVYYGLVQLLKIDELSLILNRTKDFLKNEK